MEPALIGLLPSNLLSRALEVRRRHERETGPIIDHAGKDADPFAGSDRTDFVFGSIKDDAAILPKDVIHAVVGHCKLATRSNAQTDGLVLTGFRNRKPVSRRKISRQLLELLAEQGSAGRDALHSLERAATRHSENTLSRLREEAGIVLDVRSKA